MLWVLILAVIIALSVAGMAMGTNDRARLAEEFKREEQMEDDL